MRSYGEVRCQLRGAQKNKALLSAQQNKEIKPRARLDEKSPADEYGNTQCSLQVSHTQIFE